MGIVFALSFVREREEVCLTYKMHALAVEVPRLRCRCILGLGLPLNNNEKKLAQSASA